MEIQFPKSDFGYLKPVCRESQEQELTQELRLSDGMPDIGRVLSAWGQVVLRSKEWRSDSISFSGGIMAWVLYAPEDGTQPRCLESWIPFQMKWDIEDGFRDGNIRIQSVLRFVDARSVSARKMMLRMGVAALGEAWLPNKAEIYAPGEVSGDIQLLNASYPVHVPKEAGEKTFLMDEDLMLPGSCPVPEKLVYYTMEPKIQEKKIVGNKAVFRGNGNLHVLYISEEGILHSWDFEIPFSQFAEMEQTHSSDAHLDVWMGVTSLELELDQEHHLRLKCGALAQFLCNDRETLSLVADAYSPSMQVTPDVQMLHLPTILEQKQITMEARESIHKDANAVVDTRFLTGFPRQRRSGDQVQWEVPGMFQTLYYDGSNALQSGNTRWEGQLSMDADESSEMKATVMPGDQPESVAGADKIDMRGQTMVDIQTTSQQGIPMVAGLNVAQRELQQNKPSLVLRRAGDETLWQIAKDTGSTMDAIRRANGLESEPAWNQMLLIPIP